MLGLHELLVQVGGLRGVCQVVVLGLEGVHASLVGGLLHEEGGLAEDGLEVAYQQHREAVFELEEEDQGEGDLLVGDL